MKSWLNNSLENPISSNQQSNNELWSVLKWYDFLIQKYWKEIVESALQSLEIIWKFLAKPLDVKDLDIMEIICEHLSKYNDEKEYRIWNNKEFWSEDCNLTYTFSEILREQKDRILEGQTISSNYNYYNILEKYIWKDSKCADLFCWERHTNYSSIHGTVLIFSLLGVDKILAVDLFNQDNEIQHNIPDWNYWYPCFFPKLNSRESLPWEVLKIQTINNGGCEVAFPKFDIFNIKFDSKDCLKVMPDNSLDAIMINNVDLEIVSDVLYIESFRSEVKRVVKNKWLIFWYWTTLWPKNVDYLSNESNGFVAFENNK